VVLAEAIGGSADQFAEIMTSRAHALGMTNTHFNNPNGLPDDGQLSSARDMATLAEALIQRFPKFYPYFSTRSFVYEGKERVNHNHLMSRYPGMDGIKTGFIRASGFNLTASAVRAGHRLIAVVFGGASAVSRDNYMAGLLDDGFRRIAGQPQQTVVASAAPLPPDPGAQNPAAAAQPEAAAMEIAATDKGGHEVKEGEIDGVKLSEAVGASAPPAAASQIAVNEADLSLGESSTEGEGDISEAPAPEPGHPLSHLHKIVLHAPQKQPGTGSWSVQIGTFSNKASSDAELKKAALRLPGGVKEKAAAASVPLSYRRKHVFRAEFTGLSELEAKKACSVLSHCLTIKPAA
jgi:D-alanyl-D-alanine carboxypeptidase